MRARARGAGLLIAVLLIVTVASFAVIVGASQSGGDIQGNDALADSIEALYLAESGVERALKRYATGVATCGAALAETITDLSQFGPALPAGNYPKGRTITIRDGLATDLSNPPVALAAAQTQCRVRVTATINSSNVSRTIHAIVDRNLLEGPDNPTFNNPSTVGAPTGWTIATNPPVGYPAGFAAAGGPDCTRSAWLVKTAQGNFTSTAQISVPVAFSVVAGSQTIVTFHWRLGSRTPGGCNAGGNTGPAFPGAPCPAAGGDGQACFRFTPAGAGGGNFMQKNLAVAATIAVACPAGNDPGTPGPYACAGQYQNPPTAGMAYPNKEQLTFNMGGGNITQFLLNLRLRNAGRKEIFIDHIEARNTTAIGAAHVRVWRDCSSAADPTTCL